MLTTNYDIKKFIKEKMTNKKNARCVKTYFNKQLLCHNYN